MRTLSRAGMELKLEELKARKDLVYAGTKSEVHWVRLKPGVDEWREVEVVHHTFGLVMELKYHGLEESPNVATDFFYDQGPKKPNAPPWPQVMWSDCPDRPPVTFQWVLRNANRKYAGNWVLDGSVFEDSIRISIRSFDWLDEEWWKIVLGADFRSFKFEDDPCAQSNEQCGQRVRANELDSLSDEEYDRKEEEICQQCTLPHKENWVMEIGYDGTDDLTLRAIIAGLWLATRGNGYTLSHCRDDGSISLVPGGLNAKGELEEPKIRVIGYECCCTS